MDSISFGITEEETHIRLDKLLSLRFPAQSRAYFQQLIEQKLVLINGMPIKKRIKPQPGDEIEVTFALLPEISVEPEKIPLDILYEDEDLLIVNKPVGMVVHPAPGHWTGTFANALLFHCKQLSSKDSLRPGIVHRLDKDTTGVLIAAKTESSHQALVSAFANRSVYKEYLAVCLGHTGKEGTFDGPIARHPIHRTKMCVAKEGGKEAVTHFKTLATTGELSFLSLILETGRTHQIRAHLSHHRTPLLGDPLYGSKSSNLHYKAQRPLLHAHRLRLPHPTRKTYIEAAAPLPKDLESWAQKIYNANILSPLSQNAILQGN